MKNVSLLVKPASGQCDMRCRYCFYHDLMGKRDEADRGVMSAQTAQALVEAAFQAVEPGGEIQLTFQGGEPTLAGLEYFRQFAAYEKRYTKPGIRVCHAIQTNGLHLNRAWARFFREQGYLVGLSIDGAEDIHNHYRADARGRGTWSGAADALALLQEEGVEVNLLCVVTGQCGHSAARVYDNLKRLGGKFLQFIPCLDPDGEVRGGRPFSLRPSVYGKFLCALFDAWYRDWKSGRYVSIRLFDDYVHRMMGLPAGTCSTFGTCGGYLVVEADGCLYPCDFYALDQWKLGRIGEVGLVEAAAGEIAVEFYAQSMQRPGDCAACRWRTLCGGGCRRDWITVNGKLENYYCTALQRFFAYAEDRLKEIACAEIRQSCGQDNMII